MLLNGERFLLEVRRETGRPPGIRRLPLLLHELKRGDREAAVRRLIGEGAILPWDALGHVMQCNEYGAGYRSAVAATLPHMKPPFRTIADEFREHCDLWLPRPSRQADTTPVVSDVPTLVVHGEYDPTNVSGAPRRMTAGLRNSYVYTFPGEGHAGPPVGCHGSIVRQFLENPTRAPDASRLARMPGIVFSTDGFDPAVSVVVTSPSKQPSPFVGTWDGTALSDGPDWTFALEIDGARVRGIAMQGLPIFDGAADSATIMFKVMSLDSARTVTFRGRRQGDAIEFTREVEVTAGGNPGRPGLHGREGPPTFSVKKVR